MHPRSAVVALVALGGCLVLAPAALQAQKKQRDLVKREEILASSQREDDLFSALRSLRPRFLEPPTGIRTLGNSIQMPTMVVIDGKRMGDLETLRSVIASTVDEVRYLEPSKASTEFGSNAAGGAVVVKLWKEPAKAKAAPIDSVVPAASR